MSESPQRLPMADVDLQRARLFAVKRARARGCTESEAEDVAQDVMIRLLELPDPPRNVEAFLNVAVRNRVIDRWRAAGARPEETDLEFAGSLGRVPGPSEAGMRAAALAHLIGRLREVLSDRQIEVLVLDAQGFSHAQIAVATGYKNAAAVKTTLARAREKAQGLGDELFGEIRGHSRVY